MCIIYIYVFIYLYLYKYNNICIYSEPADKKKVPSIFKVGNVRNHLEDVGCPTSTIVYYSANHT